MRPFNIELAKQGKPVITRSGKPYKFGAYNPDAIEGCGLIGWVDRTARTHYNSGKYLNSNESDNDLFMAPEKKEGWINIYNKKSDVCGYEGGFGVQDYYYGSKEEAELNKPDGYVATAYATWEK